MTYIYLALAILLEIIGTSLLKASQGFSKLALGIAALLTLCACFLIFSQVLKGINLGVAYAIWSGVGIVVTTILGIYLWKESTNLMTLFGIALILVGVVIVNLYGSGH
ncbi:DMT family transporter [Streptococcus loxodontisalivarius]|uniref:Small multidrug resistance pump n=1 Tax=Streptococcus loxodontisalivarius TaxID=1349415 RepID=A0ABS2PSG3_9STRE|nr:multidrug efflux SMR transporter [Streptococcus loxodontisalivarius]MBM7642978.1 small multidrug resistance pump [Streptococcus loxodontisalivarius]